MFVKKFLCETLFLFWLELLNATLFTNVILFIYRPLLGFGLIADRDMDLIRAAKENSAKTFKIR